MIEKPISLYFDIPSGEHIDMEVVARSAIEWVGLIREIAALVAPGIEIDIELVQTEDGSLWLNNLIKAVKSGDRKALAAIVWAVLAFFAAGPALHLQADFGTKLLEALGHKDFADISPEDRQDIADRVAKKLGTQAIEVRRYNLIREVERDPRVRAIGVAPAPRKDGPISRIAREQFPFYTLPFPPEAPPSPKETYYRSGVRLKILRANLKEGDQKPRWRFADGETEWSADIEDEEFVDALNAHNTGLPLAVGQTMVVELAIDRRLVDDEWEVTNHRITRVTQPHVPRRQRELSL